MPYTLGVGLDDRLADTHVPCETHRDYQQCGSPASRTLLLGHGDLGTGRESGFIHCRLHMLAVFPCTSLGTEDDGFLLPQHCALRRSLVLSGAQLLGGINEPCLELCVFCY